MLLASELLKCDSRLRL